jgi:hypothetical protein
VTPTAPADPLDGADVVEVVIAALTSRDVQVAEPQSRGSSRLGIPGTLATIGESDWIEIAEFPEERFAVTQASSISLDGGLLSGHSGFGVGVLLGPSGDFYFRLGKSLIYYKGDDIRVVNTLEALGAELFAGGENLLAKGADAVKRELMDRGFEITEPDPFVLGMEMFGNHRSKFFYVDGEVVHIWEHGQYANLSGAVRSLSPDGMYSQWRSDDPQPFEWDGTPYFFEQGESVALYVGDNREIIDALREMTGREIAGGDMNEVYPLTADAVQARLESFGLTVERDGTMQLELSSFGSPGERWLLNGELVEVFVFEGPWLTGYGPQFKDYNMRWHATPRLFERENAAVFYAGDDEAVVAALEMAFGWNQLSTGDSAFTLMGLATGQIKSAGIDDIQVYSRQPHMSGHVAMVKSENGGCLYYNDHTVEQDGHRIIITVTNRDTSTAWEPREDGVKQVCTADLRYHRTYVPLHEGLIPGQEYTVEVNGKEWATFVAE